MARNRDLADDTVTRIRTHVENSAPNTERPRLSEKKEKLLADLDQRSAACYAGMEELTYRVGKLAEDIEKGPPSDDEE
jgi:hypothetical protein